MELSVVAFPSRPTREPPRAQSHTFEYMNQTLQLKGTLNLVAAPGRDNQVNFISNFQIEENQNAT